MSFGYMIDLLPLLMIINGSSKTYPQHIIMFFSSFLHLLGLKFQQTTKWTLEESLCFPLSTSQVSITKEEEEDEKQIC